MSIGLAIQAALVRAERHEQMCRRKLRVRIGFQCYLPEPGHHADGLQIVATVAARDDDELQHNKAVRLVPFDQIDARAHELVGLVDAAVAEIETRFGLRSPEAAT